MRRATWPTAVMLAGVLTLGGCATKAQTGAGTGAGAGALIGQAAGGDTESTLIGAGAGAAAGYIIGNEMDKADRRERQRRQDQAASPDEDASDQN